MPYWKRSTQLDIAAWRSHVRKAIELLVPGEWDDRGDIEDDLRLNSTTLSGTADGKRSKFKIKVSKRMWPDIVTKPVISPEPGYNYEYEEHVYPREIDSTVGHKNVSFSCEVTAYLETLGFGANQIASSDNLDTPYEVAEFVRAAIVGYSDDGGEPEEAPEPRPPVPSTVPSPVLTASAPR